MHKVLTRNTRRFTWIKTRFHISMHVGSSLLTSDAASRLPILSKWISVHGPHGPVSPISQKLSCSECKNEKLNIAANLTMWCRIQRHSGEFFITQSKTKQWKKSILYSQKAEHVQPAKTGAIYLWLHCQEQGQLSHHHQNRLHRSDQWEAYKPVGQEMKKYNKQLKSQSEAKNC